MHQVFILNLGQFEPKSAVNIRVEDLKQCVDPEESDVHNFTFSSEKKPYEVSWEKRIPESYESALKRIPLEYSSSGKKNKLRSSQSASKLFSDNKGLNSAYLKRRWEMVSDTSCSEIDVNRLHFNQDVRYSIFLELSDRFSTIALSNKKNFRKMVSYQQFKF